MTVYALFNIKGSDSGIETGEHWTPGHATTYYHGLPVSYSTDQDPESSSESYEVRFVIYFIYLLKQ